MSMMGFEMVFPIIRVKDKATGKTHILGTNSHDTLHIDRETGGLHYMDLQTCEGTEGRPAYADLSKAGYEFTSEDENEFSPFVEVELVTLDTLMKICKEQTEVMAEQEKYFREVVMPSLQKLKDEVFKNAKNGISHT